MCCTRGEFRIGSRDVLLGIIHGNTPVYIGALQLEYWQHTRLTIDVVPGRGAGFSLAAPEGVRFLIRSRLFTDEEAVEMLLAGPPLRGPEAAGLA